MNSNRVWYPGKSVAESQDVDGCEEWGRGWSTAAPEAKVPRERTTPEKAKRVKIPRRTSSVATKDCRPATSACDTKLQARVGPTEEEGEGLSYSTIERRSWRGVASLLDCELHAPEHLTRQGTDFCGWMEREDLSKHATSTSKLSSTSHPMDRSSLQTPAEAYRSNPPSRAGSRFSSVRREHYDFRHLAEPQDYIDHYRQLYCYSSLNFPTNSLCKTITETVGKGDEDEDWGAENFMPLGVKSLYRGDPYLRELASRLGVRGPPRVREQQLLKSPHPTTPSITKRSRKVTDLSVCPHGKREEENDNSNNSSEKASKDSSKVNSPQTSRPFSRDVHQSEPRPLELTQPPRPLSRDVQQREPRPLELPTIPQTPSIPHRAKRHKDKSSSVISVAKYLRVSSHPQPNSDVVDNTETTGAKESVHSFAAEELSSSSSLTVEELNFGKKHSAAVTEVQCVEEEVRKARFSLPEPLSLLDDHQKEQLISQKAHSLGLLSRGWAKAPHIRRIMSSYIQENWQESGETSYSRPVTCGRGKRNDHSSSGVLKDKKAGSHGKGESPSELRPRTSRSRSVDNSKLDKLKSIYNPEKVDKTKASTQQLSGSRCVSRLKSRPTTRLSDHDHHGKTCSSRPPTSTRRNQPAGYKRAGQLPTATVKEVDMECGHYWNEVRNKTRTGRREAKLPSRPVTRSGQVGGAQRSHSVALAIRLRKPQVWELPANGKDVQLDIHQQNSIPT